MGAIIFDLLFRLSAPQFGAEEKRRFGRAIGVGYLSTGILGFLTDKILANVPFVVIMLTDTLCSIGGGFVCAVIAGDSMMGAATLCLIIFGEIAVLASTAVAWQIQPQWFSVSLLALFSLGVWFGSNLWSRRSSRSRARPQIRKIDPSVQSRHARPKHHR
jgi:uncharacterized membrane protein YccC